MVYLKAWHGNTLTSDVRALDSIHSGIVAATSTWTIVHSHPELVVVLWNNNNPTAPRATFYEITMHIYSTCRHTDCHTLEEINMHVVWLQASNDFSMHIFWLQASQEFNMHAFWWTEDCTALHLHSTPTTRRRHQFWDDATWVRRTCLPSVNPPPPFVGWGTGRTTLQSGVIAGKPLS